MLRLRNAHTRYFYYNRPLYTRCKLILLNNFVCRVIKRSWSCWYWDRCEHPSRGWTVGWVPSQQSFVCDSVERFWTCQYTSTEVLFVRFISLWVHWWKLSWGQGGSLGDFSLVFRSEHLTDDVAVVGNFSPQVDYLAKTGWHIGSS